MTGRERKRFINDYYHLWGDLVLTDEELALLREALRNNEQTPANKVRRAEWITKRLNLGLSLPLPPKDAIVVKSPGFWY